MEARVEVAMSRPQSQRGLVLLGGIPNPAPIPTPSPIPERVCPAVSQKRRQKASRSMRTPGVLLVSGFRGPSLGAVAGSCSAAASSVVGRGSMTADGAWSPFGPDLLLRAVYSSDAPAPCRRSSPRRAQPAASLAFLMRGPSGLGTTAGRLWRPNGAAPAAWQGDPERQVIILDDRSIH